jgi:hypothetical protein
MAHIVEPREGTYLGDVSMSKYDPLMEYLDRSVARPVELTFEEIASMVAGLPISAYNHPAWWANESPGGHHVQAHAWLSSGRHVIALDQPNHLVRFSAPDHRTEPG